MIGLILALFVRSVTEWLSLLAHRMYKRGRSIAPLLALVMCAVVTGTASAVASYTTWTVTDEHVATAYLDGDALSDRVEAAVDKGITQLIITFGDGRVAGIPIGVGESVALSKLSSGDITGNGTIDLVVMTNDPARGDYKIAVITDPSGDYTLLPMPDAGSDAAYKFSAVFTRGYVLELNNQTYDFMLSVPIEALPARAAYRDDGTAPTTLRANVSSFTDYTLTMYGERLALELWQTITTSAQEEPLGFIVSTVIWSAGAPKLVGQRFTVK